MVTYMRHLKDHRAAGEKGFTLIELLIVIVIVGILAAVAVPMFLSQRSSAHEAALKSDVVNAAQAMESAYVAGTGYTALAQGTDFAVSNTNTTVSITVCPGNESFIINAFRVDPFLAAYYESVSGGLTDDEVACPLPAPLP